MDTGASVNVLDEMTYKSLSSTTKFDKTSVKIYPYNSHRPVELLGKLQATVEAKMSWSCYTPHKSCCFEG